MARIELTPRDEVRVAAARVALADVKRIHVTDLVAAIRLLGRMESTIESLLAVVDEGGDV